MARTLSGIYHHTRSYSETMEQPLIPSLLLNFIHTLEMTDSPAATESRVSRAGGWEPMGTEFAQQVLTQHDDW